MNTSRRKFFRTGGAGALGFGLLPVFSQAEQFFIRAGGFTDFVGTNAFAAGLPRTSPESQGVSSKAISGFINAANASGISWHSFMLLRHGNVVAEGWWKPFEPAFKHSLYSLSKSFTSTAVGAAISEGKLTLDAAVISFFPEDLPAKVDDNLKKMTVRHLLTMNTGHESDTLPKMRSNADQAWTKTFLAQPLKFEPGSHFLYNTGATYMLGAIVHKITGENLEKYLASRLFEPLGIKGYDWETSPQGLNTAGFGLRVKTEDIAKFGQLYLQKGKWDGKQVLPEAWVQEATSLQTKSDGGGDDWKQGYGYQFWRCKPGCYRGDGAFGQYCIVIPDQDAVLAVTEQSGNMQDSLNIIWEQLLPALQPGKLSENPADQAGLKKELEGLTLPVPKGAPDSYLASKYHNKDFDLDKNEMNALRTHFRFSQDSCEWTTTRTGEKKSVSIRFGWENWQLNKDSLSYPFPEANFLPAPSKLAGTATWIDGNTLQLNARFVEAIHGDTITCVFEGNKLTISFLNSFSEIAKDDSEKRKPITGTLRPDSF